MAKMMHKCVRCGETFVRKENLRRHLKKDNTCPPKYSHTGPKVLLKRLEDNVPRPFVCSDCGRSYINASSLTRHAKSCLRSQTPTKNRLEEMFEELGAQLGAQLVAQIQNAFSASAAPVGGMTIGGGSMVIGNAVNNNNNNTNIDAHKVYNINAWDPKNFDMELLSEVDSLNSPMHRYFGARDPIEALFSYYMRKNPPTNYFAYSPSNRLEDVRFFNGQKYVKVDDPAATLDVGYQTIAKAFIAQVQSKESEFDDQFVLQGGEPEQFESQKLKVLSAETKENRVSVIMDKIANLGPAIKGVIDAKAIHVEDPAS